MKVYVLRPDVNKYRSLLYGSEKGIVEFSRRFDGRTIKYTWTGKERKFEFYKAPRLVGDFPGLSSHIPVFNRKAVNALADMLEGNGELLPITCDGEDYFLFNVTRVVDTLNEENSQVKRFSSGRIMYIVRYSFFPNRLVGLKVFKIPQAVLMDVLVTDDFVERVKATKLKGFECRLVWTDEKNPFL